MGGRDSPGFESCLLFVLLLFPVGFLLSLHLHLSLDLLSCIFGFSLVVFWGSLCSWVFVLIFSLFSLGESSPLVGKIFPSFRLSCSIVSVFGPIGYLGTVLLVG